MKKYCVHAYIGEGKGKSTAAAGLCLRALGAGKSALLVQLLKQGSSENAMLEKLGAHIVAPAESKFVWDMDDEERRRAAEKIEAALRQAEAFAYDGCDMIIFDEILGACEEGLVSAARLIELTRLNAEVVFTGRKLPRELYAYCDYISEILPIAHPFSKGGAARKGIEF